MWVDGLEHRYQVVSVDQTVLHVDAYVVESEKRGRLGSDRGWHLQPASEFWGLGI
jgi:hypothetical protein